MISGGYGMTVLRLYNMQYLLSASEMAQVIKSVKELPAIIAKLEKLQRQVDALYGLYSEMLDKLADINRSL